MPLAHHKVKKKNSWFLTLRIYWLFSISTQELVPMDTQASFQSSRLQILAVQNSVEKLKDVGDRMTARALGVLSLFHHCSTKKNVTYYYVSVPLTNFEQFCFGTKLSNQTIPLCNNLLYSSFLMRL